MKLIFDLASILPLNIVRELTVDRTALKRDLRTVPVDSLKLRLSMRHTNIRRSLPLKIFIVIWYSINPMNLYPIFFAIPVNEFVSVKFIPSFYCRGFWSKLQKSISHRVVLQKRAPYQSSMSWKSLLNSRKWPLIPATITLVGARTVFGPIQDNDMGAKNCPKID